MRPDRRAPPTVCEAALTHTPLTRQEPQVPGRIHLASIHINVIALAAIAIARPLAAQAPESATLSVNAQLISPVTIGATRALDFGRLFANGSKTVAPNSATSGRIEVSGMSGSNITLSITMPSTLKTAAGDAISLSGWNYMMSPDAGLSGASSVSFPSGTPHPFSATIGGISGVTKLYLGVGAMVQTLANSAMGAYSATGQVTAAYADL